MEISVWPWSKVNFFLLLKVTKELHCAKNYEKNKILINKYKVTNEPNANTILPLKDGLECSFVFLSTANQGLPTIIFPHKIGSLVQALR
jgi:hypothetical protein